jgi:hypothetical protein
MTERVDKSWKDKGLGTYSTAAILGTLGHYGAAVDEASVKSAALEKFPMELALDWRETWKGKGQFASFPYAAANELMARLAPERPLPMKLAQLIGEAVAKGMRATPGNTTDVNASLGAFENVLPTLPPKGERRDAFVRELVGYIEQWATAFNSLPERLASMGLKEEALRFASMHEELFPDRAGCVQALVRSVSGDRDAAVADLTAWAGDSARDVYARYSALDVLMQLEERDVVKQHGLAIFDAAAQSEKWRLADTVAHLLGHLVEHGHADAAFSAEVRRRLDLAHSSGGGHH